MTSKRRGVGNPLQGHLPELWGSRSADDELVEDVAMALWLHHRGVEQPQSWPVIPEPQREWFRGFARVAIAAVRKHTQVQSI